MVSGLKNDHDCVVCIGPRYQAHGRLECSAAHGDASVALVPSMMKLAIPRVTLESGKYHAVII